MEKSQKKPNRIKDEKKVRHHIERSTHHLEEYTRQIDGFIKRSENIFLSVGNSIKDFHKDSLGVGEKSLSLLDLILGKETLSVCTGLVTILESLSKYTGHVDHLMHPKIEKIDHMLDEFETVSDSLQDLDTMTEQVRTILSEQETLSRPAGQGNTAGQTITGDTKKLCSKICLYAEKISTAIKSADTRVREHASEMQKQKYSKRDHLQSIVNSVGNVLDSFTEKKQRFKGVERDISDRNTEVSKSISEIVVSLQFQDITHQSLNKVEKGLSELREDLKSGSSQLSDKPAEELTSLLEKTATVSTLLADALEKTRDTFIYAIEVTIKNLNTISDNVISISDTVNRVAKDAFESELSQLTGIEQGFVQMSENPAEEQDIQPFSELLAPYIKDLITYESDLAYFETDVQNVNRARKGQSSNSTQVTATEALMNTVCRLYDSALSLSRDTNAALSGISTDKDWSPEGENKSGTSMLKTILEEFSAYPRKLQVINKNIKSILNYTKKVSKALSNDFKYRLNDLSTLKNMNVFVQQMISDMDLITSYCRKLLPDESVVKIVVRDKKSQFDPKKSNELYNPTDLTIEEIVDLYDNIDIF
jgi:uncharacterized protein YoxC